MLDDCVKDTGYPIEWVVVQIPLIEIPLTCSLHVLLHSQRQADSQQQFELVQQMTLAF